MNALVVVPTYNEIENIETLLREILAQGDDVEVLVVDDGSPDGTGRSVAELGRGEPRVHLLARSGPRGRGRAGRDGFAWALQRGARLVFEMDGDRSHPADHLPALRRALADHDLVLGSRQVPGGQDLGRPAWRVALTRLSNLYVRSLLGVRVRDTNSGYRGWTREALQAVQAGRARSPGPAIVHELLYKASLRGLRITEVPIGFRERERGVTKLNLATLLRSYVAVAGLLARRLTGRLFEPAP